MAISNTTLVLKKSGVSGNTPTALANGELAINYADGKLYYKNTSGNIVAITSNSSSSSANSFATINANSSLILATSNNDTLSFVAGNNISISTNTTSKTITINSSVSSANNFIVYNFPLGNYGLVTQTVYGGLGNEQTGTIFDMRAQPTTGGITFLDSGYLI